MTDSLLRTVFEHLSHSQGGCERRILHEQVPVRMGVSGRRRGKRAGTWGSESEAPIKPPCSSPGFSGISFNKESSWKNYPEIFDLPKGL